LLPRFVELLHDPVDQAVRREHAHRSAEAENFGADLDVVYSPSEIAGLKEHLEGLVVAMKMAAETE
jgi:hypothetical protein